MPYYRKLPVVIEAIRYTPHENCQQIRDFLGQEEELTCPVEDDEDSWPWYIKTLEGTMEASPGDYIIKGIKGEFYPVKPDIFESTYELVDGGVTHGRV